MKAKPSKPTDTKRPPKAKQVREFMERFNASRDLEVNLKGLNEELLEWEQGIENVLKEACDVLYMAYCVEACKPVKGQVDQDTIKRLRRVVALTNMLYGTDRYTEAFARVHISNMTKLGADGKPIYNDWGKVIKGPNYQPPFLWDLIV